MSIKALLTTTFLIFSVFCTKTPAREHINIGYGVNNSPPYALIEQEQLAGGVIYDIAVLLAKELDLDINFVLLPRTRVEQYLLDGTLDVYFISNPKWITAPEIIWSEPMFDEQNVIVQLSGEQDFTKLSDLYEKRIGTVHGYIYPALTGAFERQDIYRSDVKSLQDNFQRLDKGWIDGFVGSDILIHHALQKSGEDERFQIASYLVSHHEIRTAISPKSKISVAKLLAVINRLTSDGVIDKILAGYIEH